MPRCAATSCTVGLGGKAFCHTTICSKSGGFGMSAAVDVGKSAAFAESTRILRTSGSLRAFRCCRSEEHTSELQSLMRYSYAVFCLKKTIYGSKCINVIAREGNRTHIINLFSFCNHISP